MAGGIVQLAVYGTQDVFLTGAPQITFFKIVYRRHTNFSIESIQQHIMGNPNFGSENICKLDKLGDLVHKIYLQINLPQINLTKNINRYSNNPENISIEFEKIQNYYKLVYDYVKINFEVVRKLTVLLRTSNVSINEIDSYMQSSDIILLIEKRNELQMYIKNNPDFSGFEELIKNKESLYYQINRIDIQKLYYSTTIEITEKSYYEEINIDTEIKRQLLRIITTYLYDETQNFYLSAYNLYIEKEKIFNEINTGGYEERYKFAWVEEIGHAVIDKIDFEIGSNVIDSQTGDWLIINNRYFKNIFHDENYNKMIGNIHVLTDFDDNIKPEYVLNIPLQFWFCKNNALALPLVALQYSESTMKIKFKSIEKVCYIEDTNELSDIWNVQNQYRINFNGARFYVDYIFLDGDERKRFAKSMHEYLIEVVQRSEFDGIITPFFNEQLRFSHPTKMIIWFVQPMNYRNNYNGINKCQWNNFGLTNEKTEGTLEQTYITLNGQEFSQKKNNPEYYNYVQSYERTPNIAQDGLYSYSFSLKPQEHQPSGTCNFGRIDDLTIFMKFKQSNEYYVGIYTISYNILRILSGMGAVAFETSA